MYFKQMSVASSRVTSLSSIIRNTPQIVNQPNRVYYRPPKSFKHILFGYKLEKKREYENMISSLRGGAIKVSK